MAANRHNTRSLPRAVPSGSLPIVILAAALAVGFAALLPLLQNSLATSTGGSIAGLEQEREDWLARVHEQEVEVARLGSLERIEQEARVRLKMVEPQDVVYIPVDVAPPEPRRLPGRYLPPADEQRGDESLIDNVFGWLPF